MGKSWPQEREARLLALCERGLSASKIAAELGEGITKSTITSKLKRLKVKLHLARGRYVMPRIWEELEMSPQCEDVLSFIYLRSPNVVPLEDLVTHLYPDVNKEPENSYHIPHIRVCNIRRALKAHGAPLGLITGPGRQGGYSVNDELAEWLDARLPMDVAA